MHLAAYHFTGDPDQLVRSYKALLASLPDVELNLCVAGESGITVFDACPTAADFEAFSSSAAFADGLRSAGLPTPRIESLGAVESVAGSAMAPAS